MSLRLIRLKLRNFLSFGNNDNELDLSFEGSTHILGENMDDGGNMGCGKTTIMNAISYALFNKPLSAISKERLINRTNDRKDTQMEVALTFEVDGIEYEIYRSRGESYEIKLYINGEDKTPDSIDNINKKIVEITGVSYELFKRTVVFTGGDVSFFELPVSQQRSLIEELFKITSLSEKADALRKEINKTEKDIDIAQAVITHQEAAKETRQKHIKQAEERTIRWESEREDKIERLNSRLESIQGVDFEAEQDHHKIVNEETERLNEYVAIYNEAQRKFKDATKKYTTIQGQIEHLADNKCPFCLQDFKDVDQKIKELEEEMNKVGNIADENEKVMRELDEPIEKVKLVIEKHQTLIKYPNIQKLIETKNNKESIERQIKELEEAINPHIEAYDALIAEDDVVVDYSKIDDLKTELEHQKFLLKLLTDKNSFIRKKLINKNLPTLNKQMNHYTRELGLMHVVKFLPDMSCEISEHGRELDYGNLSGGEKKRVNLALSLAFRDVLQNLHSNINILLVDEVDAGSVCPLGMESMIKVLKQKSYEQGMGLWIVSHRQEMVGRWDRELIVRKENGFSNFIEQDL